MVNKRKQFVSRKSSLPTYYLNLGFTKMFWFFKAVTILNYCTDFIDFLLPISFRVIIYKINSSFSKNILSALKSFHIVLLALSHMPQKADLATSPLVPSQMIQSLAPLARGICVSLVLRSGKSWEWNLWCKEKF